MLRPWWWGCGPRSRSRWSSSDCRCPAFGRPSTSSAAWISSPRLLRPLTGTMTSQAADSLALTTSEHVVMVRQAVRQRAVEMGFSLVDQTKIVTAASELARNALMHGGGGRAVMEMVSDGSRRGLRLAFEDQGPGIADVQLAMKDGYSTAGGLGLGLSGAKRLSNEFAISSTPGGGTRVVITRWK